MAKQTFTTGQVLTAAQMTSLQQTAMLGGAASAKTASYTLVAADAGTAISMSNASATTITVNTGLFAAGDTVQITNLGAGVCTITAGTATVNTSASLALAQYESGTLDFTTSSAAIFIKGAGAAAGGGGAILQVVNASTTSTATIATTTYTDTNITATITPTLNTSKILVIANAAVYYEGLASTNQNVGAKILRGATSIFTNDYVAYTSIVGSTSQGCAFLIPLTYMDSPATTSATTYKVQGRIGNTASASNSQWQHSSYVSSIILLEIGA